MRKQVIARVLLQPDKNFPIDCETIASLQNNAAAIQLLGNIVGDKAILYGCALESNGTRRGEGYVFLRTTDYPEGEVVYWEGGNVSGGMYLHQESIAVTAQGYDFPQAYTERSLRPGVGGENYSWADFKQSKTPLELEEQIASLNEQIALLAPPPLGVVQMWAGNTAAGSFPDNYRYCDASQLAVNDYPDLFAVIGRLHTPAGVPTGYFCLPDLRSRFVVGYNPTDSDHNAQAKAGGTKTVTLTTDQIPTHSHAFSGNVWRAGTPLPYARIGTAEYGVSGDSNVSTASDFASGAVGGGAAHENRPPYYTLAYIMRVK